MRQYLDFLQHILDHGTFKLDRTNTGTHSCFGYQMRFDLNQGFPLLTTKKVHFKSVLHELLWFISGDTNIRYLVQNKVRIWNEWPYAAFQKSEDYQEETMDEFVDHIINDAVFAAKHGELGPVYGKQWRRFEGKDGRVCDQLQTVIDLIKTNPDSRRLIVNSWNPTEIEDMALPPCHMMFQFYVKDNTLSSQLYQRSADAFLGVPFNIASYALLTMMVAHVCQLKLGDFVHTMGDVHIYDNLMDQVNTQLTREPRTLPQVVIKRQVNCIDGFSFDDFALIDYNPHPAIKGKVAV